MAAGFLITRLLLVFFLWELDYSSAFPRARSSMYPEASQGEREKKQEGYGYGNRHPLLYIQALRQPHRKLQPNVHSPQVKTWQNPQESSLTVHSHAQIQNQPSLYHKTQRPHRLWSDVSTKWTQERSPPQLPPERNYPLPKPRSFEFSLKIPFANIPGQNKDSSSTTRSTDLNIGGSDGTGHDSQLYRPSSVQIHSSFNSPSGSDSFSSKGSTKNPNEGKNAHEVSKPSFQISLSVPIPPPSPKPASSNGVNLTTLQRPGRDGVAQNGYTEPEKQQSGSTQSGSEWSLLNSASAVQQQTEHRTYEPVSTKHTDGKQIALSPEHVSQHTTPIKHISQDKIPIEQSQVFSKPQAPIPQHSPLQSDNVYSGYNSGQINPTSNDYGNGQSGQTVSPYPTLSQLQYDGGPSGQFNSGQVKPSGNNYGQRQIWQPADTQPTFASEQYNYGQFKPSFGHGQNVETAPHLSPVQLSSPSQYELPSFGYLNRKADTNNYYGTDNVVQTEQMDLSSSSYQHSKGQSGQASLPNILTAFDPSPLFQGLSTDHQTQMRLPEQYTGRGQLDGKPKYTKLLIDVEDVMDGADGQHNYFATPPTHYDGYSGIWTGQNMAETPTYNPNQLFEKFQSQVSMGQDQPTKLLNPTFDSYPSNKPECYMPVYKPTPSMDSGMGQYASRPQKQMEREQTQTSDPFPGQPIYAPHVGANASSIPTNFGQQQLSEPTFHIMPDAFSPNIGQYPVNQAPQQQQPTIHQSNYPFPVGYSQNSYGNMYSGGETQHATWAQTDRAAIQRFANTYPLPFVVPHQH